MHIEIYEHDWFGLKDDDWTPGVGVPEGDMDTWMALLHATRKGIDFYSKRLAYKNGVVYSPRNSHSGEEIYIPDVAKFNDMVMEALAPYMG